MSSLSSSTSIPAAHRRLGIRAAVLAFVTLLAVVLTAVPASADVSFINGQRAAAGLPAVQSSGGLAGIAAAHAREMASQGRLFHSSGLGSRVAGAIGSYQAAGENVGVGSSASAVNSMF